MKPASPFRYPATPLCRRHGPEGYSEYRHHRPWLRDEFDFRCLYCLKRETWAFHDEREYELDHQVAKSIAPELCREYTNLVYACANCNRRKGAKNLPSPESIAYGKCMKVKENGEIIALNPTGERIIDELNLDDEALTAKRALWIRSIRSHQQHDYALFLQWMGFPEDLPDLENVNPQPKRNRRPQGIRESWRQIKRPEYFEDASQR